MSAHCSQTADEQGKSVEAEKLWAEGVAVLVTKPVNGACRRSSATVWHHLVLACADMGGGSAALAVGPDRVPSDAGVPLPGPLLSGVQPSIRLGYGQLAPQRENSRRLQALRRPGQAMNGGRSCWTGRTSPMDRPILSGRYGHST